MSPQPAKLVNAGAPGDVHVIANLDVSGQGGMTAHHQMVSDHAIMGDVTVGQEDVVGTDHRDVIRFRRDVSGDVFPEDVVVPDLKPRVASLILEIVSQSTDQGIGINRIALSQADPTLDGGMVQNTTTIPYPRL